MFWLRNKKNTFLLSTLILPSIVWIGRPWHSLKVRRWRIRWKTSVQLKQMVYILELINTIPGTVEIPCPTWSHFFRTSRKFPFTCPWTSTMYKCNTNLYFLLWLIITSSHLALKTVWILISWLLQKPADLDLEDSWSGSILFLKE